MNFFWGNSLYLDSSVSRASVHGSMNSKFEFRLRQSFFFSLFLLLFYFEMLISIIFSTWKYISYTYVKMAILYENVIDLIIFETLKVLFGKILLKKYYSTMICGLDRNDLKGDHS